MNLEARKYKFIEELFSIDNERIIENLERVLKQERKSQQEISTKNKEQLELRLKSYKSNPDNVLDWQDVKNDW